MKNILPRESISLKDNQCIILQDTQKSIFQNYDNPIKYTANPKKIV
jgi:hypothetical protein